MKCPLCSSSSYKLFYTDLKHEFYECNTCKILFRPQSNILNSKKEKERYDAHENTIHNDGYINFVKPITNFILENYLPKNKGLDFGSGPSSVIAAEVFKQNYKMDSYDLYYHNNSELLNNKYDYISACEVIEHFKEPYKEFTQLFSMLTANGCLVCKTDIYNSSIDFKSWYYKNDPTHITIFQKESFEWIAKEFSISLTINDRVIIFRI